jgi:hypothetical protein
MKQIKHVLSQTLISLGDEVYHKLSTRNFLRKLKKYKVDKPQTVSKLMLKSPVITILYIISDICDSAPSVSRWRSSIRLLSLGWSLDSHNPYSAQVLQLLKLRVVYDH